MYSMKCFIYWTADLKSSKPWSWQFWTQFKQLLAEAWKSQDFNRGWTHGLAIAVRHSNQLSYEATYIGSWSFVGSNDPVRNEYWSFSKFLAHDNDFPAFWLVP